MNNPTTIYVLYHGGGCVDGFASAYVAWEHFDRSTNSATVPHYIPVLYGEPLPPMALDQNTDVYILDFCYEASVLRRLAEQVRTLYIIDHHKSAAKILAELMASDAFIAEQAKLTYVNNNIHFTLDTEKSGCVLTWEKFRPKGTPREDVPKLLAYIQDLDLWQWKLPGSMEINAGIRSYTQDFHTWRQTFLYNVVSVPLETKVLTYLGNEGTAILRYQKQLVAQQIQKPLWAEVRVHRDDIQLKPEVGTARRSSVRLLPPSPEEPKTISCGNDQVTIYTVPVVNCPVLQSEIGEALCFKYKNRDFSLVYFDRNDGKRIWSLRSRNKFDVSAVASAFGGGGHTAAAGFVEWMPHEGL